MGKIDTSEWKEFRVGELFAQERGKEKAPKQNEPGDCPLIQETNNNNGFDSMVVPTKIIKGNSITVSINYAQNVFYQADDFCASVNIAVLRNSHLNWYNSQFVCSVLRNAHQKFDYTSKISKELLNKEMIMLPVDKTGQPDWAYMESYMANLETKVAESLTMLQAAKDAEKKKVDTREWGEFRVGELFEVKISKSVDKGGLEFAEDGEYDFIGRTPLNNGIQGRLNKLKFEANQEGTYSIAQIGMHVCQYRERKWYASQNIFVLTPFAEKSHKANKFIATIITRYLDCAYGEDTYATYPTAKTLPHLKIKLPVDKTGQPDWAYMESYIANLETKVAESLTLLQAALVKA